MKTLLVLLSICSSLIGFGQNKFKKKFDAAEQSITTASSNGITVTDDIRLQQLGLDRKIDLSKGEQAQQKDWYAFLKQRSQLEKYFKLRDSSHAVFLNYTIGANMSPGDTVEKYTEGEKEILLKLRPKKK